MAERLLALGNYRCLLIAAFRPLSHPCTKKQGEEGVPTTNGKLAANNIITGEGMHAISDFFHLSQVLKSQPTKIENGREKLMTRKIKNPAEREKVAAFVSARVAIGFVLLPEEGIPTTADVVTFNHNCVESIRRSSLLYADDLIFGIQIGQHANGTILADIVGDSCCEMIGFKWYVWNVAGDKQPTCIRRR